MPTGSKCEKRPADVTSNAVHVTRIATIEIEEGAPAGDGKDHAAKALGAKGGAARARSMTPERRVEIAEAAATVRERAATQGKAGHRVSAGPNL